MRAVFDTNVLVSGLLTPGGPCGEIVRAISRGEVSPCVDLPVLVEYEVVLTRARFGFAPEEVEALLTQVRKDGVFVRPELLPHSLPHYSDEPFLEVALAAQADCLVTGNLRHFPAALRCGMRVLSPADFVGVLRSSRR